MINKKGSLVLRDMIFMMMMVSAIFVFAGLFVSDMATNYENTNMSSEWELTDTNTLSNSSFYNTGGDVEETASGLQSDSTGIYALVSSITNTLTGIGDALFMVLTAPNTIGSLVYGTLVDMGVSGAMSSIIKYLIVTILWGIIIFTIATAFLRGSKV